MGFYGCKYVSARNTQYPFPDLIQTDITKSRGRLTLSANEEFRQIGFCSEYAKIFFLHIWRDRLEIDYNMHYQS